MAVLNTNNLPITDNPVMTPTMERITSADRAAPDTFNPRYQVLLDNDNYLNREINKAQRTAVVNLKAGAWSATAPYSQRVSVTGMKGTDQPEVHLYTPKELDQAAVKLRQKLTGMITDGETEDGYITLYCGIKKPYADFEVLLKGVSADE